MFKLKITCLTPQGKSEQCMKEWNRSIMVFKKPSARAVVNDSEFYYIYEFEKLNDMYSFNRRIIALQPKIKGIYSVIIKLIKRANKIVNKSKWATKKVKKWFIKRITDEQQKQAIEKMDDEDFKDYLKCSDIDDMDKFLKQDIIQTEYLQEGGN